MKILLLLDFFVVKTSHILALAIGIATLVAISFAITRYGAEKLQQQFGVYSHGDGSIVDARGDVHPVFQLNGTESIPDVKDYHDIVGARIKKVDDAFLFTISLAGNPNKNENIETLYLWNLVTDHDHYYKILLPHFATGNNSTERGWYLAVFNMSSNAYIVPMAKIPDMPADRVEYPLKDFFIEAPSSFTF